MKVVLRIIGIILITVLSVVISGELFLRFFRPQMTFSRAYLQSDKCYAESPYTPFTLKPNSECKMVERNGDFNESATINMYGYRGTAHAPGSPTDEKTILILGDSFAFGYGLPDGETIPHKLEQYLESTGSAFRVINAGFRDGYGPDSYYAYMKNEGFLYAPQVIALFLFPFNDLNDITESEWEHIDERGLPGKVTSSARVVDNGVFRFRNTDIKYEIPILRESHLFIFCMDFVREKWKLFKPIVGTPDGSYRLGCALDPTCIDILLKQEYDVVMKSIIGMNDLAKDRGATFLVVMIPADYQIYKEAIVKYMRARPVPPDEPNYIQNRIGKDLSNKGILYLDLYQSFVDATPSGYPYFPNDAHFNNLGSAIAGEAIGKYLLGNGL